MRLLSAGARRAWGNNITLPPWTKRRGANSACCYGARRWGSVQQGHNFTVTMPLWGVPPQTPRREGVRMRYRIIGPYKGSRGSAQFLIAARLRASGKEVEGGRVRVCAHCFDPEQGAGGIFAGGVCSAACPQSTMA